MQNLCSIDFYLQTKIFWGVILWYCDILRTDGNFLNISCLSVISQISQYHSLKSFPYKVQNLCSIDFYLQTKIFWGVILWYCDILRTDRNFYKHFMSVRNITNITISQAQKFSLPRCRIHVRLISISKLKYFEVWYCDIVIIYGRAHVHIASRPSVTPWPDELTQLPFAARQCSPPPQLARRKDPPQFVVDVPVVGDHDRTWAHGWIIVQSVQSIWRRGHHCTWWQALVCNLSTLLSSKLMY